MKSWLLLVAVSLLIAASSVSETEAQYYGCESYSFSCCNMVNYQVYSVIAQTLDSSTCNTIKYILNGPLSNYSDECKRDYTETVCLSAIPQCCSASQPTIFQVCESVCDQMARHCGSAGNKTINCDTTPPFYPPPCNDGNGVSCSSELVDDIADLNDLEAIQKRVDEHVQSVVDSLAFWY